jgi:hypothetical protein
MRRGTRVKMYNEVVIFQSVELWCVGSKMIDHVICTNDAGERRVYTLFEFEKNKKHDFDERNTK